MNETIFVEVWVNNVSMPSLLSLRGDEVALGLLASLVGRVKERRSGLEAVEAGVGWSGFAGGASEGILNLKYASSGGVELDMSSPNGAERRAHGQREKSSREKCVGVGEEVRAGGCHREKAVGGWECVRRQAGEAATVHAQLLPPRPLSWVIAAG